MKKDLKIMVIDDEKPIVDTLLIYFERTGYNVTGFYDSKEALNALKNENYDIIFTDLKMPDVSGMDIVKNVKEQENDTIVIIFTGYATTDSAIEAIQYGVYDYIRKPFKLDEIRVVLDRAVEKLILSRENISLNRKIEKMLSQVTMLADITAILYQVSDFNEVAGMILDTVTEGLDVSKVALLSHDNNARFNLIISKDIPTDLTELFSFTENSTINDAAVDADAVTLIDGIYENGLSVDGHVIWKGDDIHEIMLIPVKYLDKLQGYIMVADPDYSDFSREDIIRIFTILSTHISPVFQIETYDILNTGDMAKTYDKLVTERTAKEIENSKTRNSSVTFSLYKLFPAAYMHDNVDIKDISDKFRQRISNEFNDRYEVLQQYYDTFLVIMPGANPLDIEFNSATIKQDIESNFTDKNGESLFEVAYASHTYMRTNGKAGEILSWLYRSVANQIVDLPNDMD